MLKIHKISLPTKDMGNVELETSNSLLFVGANGSGKTRLGAWIELDSSVAAKVHRISAQKSLAMPDTSSPKAMHLAESDLLFGKPDRGRSQKRLFRWSSKPATWMLSDFEKLMVYLFSDHTVESSKYLAASKLETERVPPPVTKLDKVKAVWEKLLPHRKLDIGGLNIQTSITDDEEKKYNASEMSDGERVIFYLIGQCLAAPTDGVIVIDEPELHLHKSVQAPLWTEVERLRPDCLFIYLTHDVDFAAAKEISKKIWLKSYDGAVWEWEEINSSEAIPEELLLEVLGSRKPVVFVEGTKGSYDAALYTEVLKKFLVIPVGSCDQVIQFVKALKANPQLHHLEVFGIIDRDRRVPAEIQKLEESFVFVLKVAEVENLFCTREVLEIVSNRLERDAVEDFQSVSKAIFERLGNELDNQISLHVASEIKYLLNSFDEKQKGAEGLENALQTLTSSIKVDAIYSRISDDFNSVVTAKNYEDLLSLYNRKSLLMQASKALDLASGELPKLVIRLAKGESRDEIVKALKKYFGDFAQHMAC